MNKTEVSQLINMVVEGIMAENSRKKVAVDSAAVWTPR
jgi:hypothetical protein